MTGVTLARAGVGSRVVRSRVRELVQRILVLVGDRYNYFLVAGMVGADRFDHRRFMSGKRWWVSTDVVRNATLELLRRELEVHQVEGAVAEVGVAEGNFAALINAQFPTRTLYLFDTFRGFDQRDLAAERARGFGAAPYACPPASVDVALSKLPHPERAVVRAGWFPESAAGCQEDRFSYVNVDVGLHEPTFAALDWFYPRLSSGGYITVTDFNNSRCRGVRSAVRRFARERGVTYAVLPDRGGWSKPEIPRRPAAGSVAAKTT